jgi:hypothetical protein
MNSSEKNLLRWVIGIVAGYFLSLWLKGKQLPALLTTILSGVGGRAAATALVP